MSQFMKNWDADQVTLVAVGVTINSGYDDGPFLKLEMADDAFKTKVGTDGSVTRYATHNNLAKMTVMLMQTSDGNALLSTIHELDKKVPGGKGIAPFMIRDRQGTSIYGGRFSWVSKPPDVTMDREPTAREWEIGCVVETRLDGGN
jgi:Protein of unknown function (DUF3277)